MKNEIFKRYLYWGMTACGVIAFSILFFFCIFRIREITGGLRFLAEVLMPIIYGLILAYLLTPVYNFFSRALKPGFEKKGMGPQKAQRLAKAVSTLISVAFTLLVIAGLFSLIVPQAIASIQTIAATVDFEKMSNWIQQTLEDNPWLETWALQFYEQLTDFIQTWMRTELAPNIEQLVTQVSSGILGTLIFLKNAAIGLIVAVYVLNSKEHFAAQAKKIAYSAFDIKRANLVVDNFRFTHRVFGGFISGKLLDSLIIGILCFICMSLLRLPYPTLISVIIGVTNVIPFFGPFIGAVPSAFFILMVNPWQCLYFIVFIFVLQQFDGNILGPKILGDSTGLSSFWVLFAILLFGGVFGFVGMIVGVPIFAVFYSFVSGLVNHSLRGRGLSTETEDYAPLLRIEAETKRFIKKK